MLPVGKKEVRMALVRAGLAGMPMRQPTAQERSACTGCDGLR